MTKRLQETNFFSEKFSRVLKALECSQAQLSRLSGVAPSIVSRLCCGARLPTKKGEQLEFLCRGLVRYATQQGQEERLAILCGRKEARGMDLQRGLQAWFVESLGALAFQREHKGHEMQARSRLHLMRFSEKLHLLLKRFHISNAFMAHELSVDPSHISRFRTGARLAGKNSSVVEKISQCVGKAIEAQGAQAKLQELVQLPMQSKSCAGYLNAWFNEDGAGFESPGLANLVRVIGKTGIDTTSVAPPLVFGETNGPRIARRRSFWGLAGFRKAILQLFELGLSGEVSPLYVYADKSVDWLLDRQPKYAARWRAMLLALFDRGMQASIIHNMDHDLPELVKALRHWVPLHLTGRISSYYCQEPSGERFLEFIFLMPGKGCIVGSCVKGEEEHAEFVFSVERKKLQNLERQFKQLLSMSSPLLRLYSSEAMHDRREYFHRMLCQNSDISVFAPSPFEGTLSRELAAEMLDAAGLGNGDLLEHVMARVQVMKKLLHKINITEFFRLARKDELRRGKVFSHMLTLQRTGRTVPYTIRTYAEHLLLLAESLRREERHHVCLLDQEVFGNVQTIVKNDCGVYLVPQPTPAYSIELLHPKLCAAFEHLGYSWRGGCETRERREKTIQFLKRHAESLLQDEL